MRPLLLALPVLLAACPPAEEELPAALGDCGEPGSWADVQPTFEQHCTSCHDSALTGEARQGAEPLVNFDSPEAARVNAFNTWAVVWGGSMPPSMDMSDADARIIWNWLSCGGPD